LAALVLLMTGTAKADVVLSFTGANAREASVNGTALTNITEPADMTVLTSLSYTVSGLTIDADGVDNDTATFTIPIVAVGAGPISWDDQTIAEFDYDNGTFGTDEGITFGNISVSGTGSGGLGYQLDSALYQEFTVRRWNNDSGDAYSILGDVTSTSVIEADGDGPNVALNDNSFTATATGGTWNVTNVDFTVEVSSVAVPEPSSLLLIAAGVGLAGFRRRRIQ